jgi:DNA-binding NarL/FixJ family response regulator
MRVAEAVADGLTDRQIADLLHIGERTVHTHLREMRWKVGANNRAHLVAIGYEQGWLGGAR